MPQRKSRRLKIGADAIHTGYCPYCYSLNSVVSRVGDDATVPVKVCRHFSCARYNEETEAFWASFQSD